MTQRAMTCQNVCKQCSLCVNENTKVQTLSACVAWQVMISRQIAHDDSEVMLSYIRC